MDPVASGRPRGEPFFFYFVVLLIIIVISGFSAFAFSRPGGPLATSLFFHFHGAVFLGWFVLVALQIKLIGDGRVKLHRRLGMLGVVWAVAIVAIGYVVIAVTIAEPGARIAGRPAVFGSVFPITDILNFGVAFGLGFAFRHLPAAHKRFMVLSALLMIDPAMARLVFSVGWPGDLILVFELVLLALLLAYDLATRKFPHWATLTGGGLFGIALVMKQSVAALDWWPVFVDALF